MPIGAAALGLAAAVAPVRFPAGAILLASFVLSLLPVSVIVLSSLVSSAFSGFLPAPAAVAELVVRFPLAELLPAAGVRAPSFLAPFVASSAPSSVARGVPATLAAVPVLRLRVVAVLVRAAAAATLLGVAAAFVPGAAPILTVTHTVATLLVSRPTATLLVSRPIAASLVVVLPGRPAVPSGFAAARAVRSATLPGAAPSPVAPLLVRPASLSRIAASSSAASLSRFVAVLLGFAAFAARATRRQAVDLPAEPAAVVLLPSTLLVSPSLSLLPLVLLAPAAVLAGGFARGPGLVARAAEHAPVIVAPAAPTTLAPLLVLAAELVSGPSSLLAALLVPASSLALSVSAFLFVAVSSPSRGSLLASTVLVPAAPALIRPFVLSSSFAPVLVTASLLTASALRPLRRSLPPALLVRPHLLARAAVTVALVAPASTIRLPAAALRSVRSPVVGPWLVRFGSTSPAGISAPASVAALPIVAPLADRSSATRLAATSFAVLFLLASIVVVLGHGRE